MGNSHYSLNTDITNLIFNIDTIHLSDIIKFITISKFFQDIFLKPQYWQTIIDSPKIISKFIMYVMLNDGNCIYPIKCINEIYEIKDITKYDISNFEYDHYKYTKHVNPCRKIIYNSSDKIKEMRIRLIQADAVNKFYKLFKNYRYLQMSDKISSSFPHGDTIYASHCYPENIQDTISMIIPDIRKIIRSSKQRQTNLIDEEGPDNLIFSTTLDPPFVIKNVSIRNIVYYSSLREFDEYYDFNIDDSETLCLELDTLELFSPHYIVKLWMPYFRCDRTHMSIFSSLPNLNFLAVEIKSSEWNNEICTDIRLNTLVLYIFGQHTIKINLPNIKYIDVNSKNHISKYDKLELYAEIAEECNLNRIHTSYCDLHAKNCCKLYVHAVVVQLQIFSKCVREIIVNKFIIGIEWMKQQYSLENAFTIDFENYETIKSFLMPQYTHYKFKIDDTDPCFNKNISDGLTFHSVDVNVQDCNDEDWGYIDW